MADAPSLTLADLQQLRQLFDGVARLPWRTSMSGYSIKSQDDHPQYIVCTVNGGARATESVIKAWLANADLIVAAVNHFDQLLTLAETALRQQADCVWTYDEDSDSWDSACGGKHCFITDGPRENEQKFCSYCGARLIEATPQPGDGQ